MSTYLAQYSPAGIDALAVELQVAMASLHSLALCDLCYVLRQILDVQIPAKDGQVNTPHPFVSTLRNTPSDIVSSVQMVSALTGSPLSARRAVMAIATFGESMLPLTTHNKGFDAVTFLPTIGLPCAGFSSTDHTLRRINTTAEHLLHRLDKHNKQIHCLQQSTAYAKGDRHATQNVIRLENSRAKIARTLAGFGVKS
jgi:hypothetical protein